MNIKLNSKNKIRYITTSAICVAFVAFTWFGSDITKPKQITVQAEKKIETQNTINETNTNNSSNTNVEKNNNSNNSNNNEKNTQTTDSQNTQTVENTQSNGKYKDGEYIGQAAGFKGDVKVKITVSNGSISNVEILENVDDPDYFNKAQTLTDTIIKSNSPEVEVISGATFSSNGIINAAKNALSSATN